MVVPAVASVGWDVVGGAYGSAIRVTQTAMLVRRAIGFVSFEVGRADWAELDPWWSAYTRVSPVARDTPSVRAVDRGGGARWNVLDSWWRANVESSRRGRTAERALAGAVLVDSWTDVDVWWGGYAETGRELVVEIDDLLDESNRVWRRSPASFSVDPLAAAVSSDVGPLIPTDEEGWSDWLAKVLRPSEALVSELFGVPVAGAPEDVVREDQLSKAEGGSRRPDILSFHTNRGISVEVKLGDEHYEKTAETASLVERAYDYDWHHTLLLPKRKRSRLEAVVEPGVSSCADGRLQVEWETPGSVAVVYWRDVSAAIREVLRRGDAVDDHWAANAYLFCAAVEQQILDFQPKPAVERMVRPADVVETVQPILFEAALGEQLTYLRARRSA